MTTQSFQSAFAPTGTLRVGINYGNSVLARRDPVSGELSGVAADMARELAKRIEVPVQLLGYESAGQMFAAVKAGAWDVAFLAVDPGRAGEIDFTAPYLMIEGTYLVPASSPIASAAEADRAGMRIGASTGAAYYLYLKRELKHGQMIEAGNPAGAFQLIRDGKADVVAGVRQNLMANAAQQPGHRVLADSFMSIGQAMGMPKGRGEAAKYLSEFVEDVKASGFVAQALARSGNGDVPVAPAAAV